MIADDTADWQAIGLRRARVAEVAEREATRFGQRTPRSAQLLESARRRMPRGVPMGWMADLYPDHPIFATRGEGARFWDADANRYLDFNLCDLSTAAGFAPQALVEAIAEQAQRGVQFLLPTEDAEVVAAELERRFRMPFWQFTLSASQANSEALRLARLATGRDRVLLFSGRYHGHLHETLHASEGDADEPEYLGLPASSGAETSVVEFNDLDAVRRELEQGDVAAALLEPVLTNCTVVLPDEGFHAQLRSCCERAGTMLIVDETHTQFAVWGGATRRFDLKPDIVTGGKGIAGGIPIGAYGISPELGALMERHPASDFVDQPGLATGGTLFANALSLAAARTTLTELLTEQAHGEIERLGNRLADGIDAAVAAHRLPWRAHRFGGRSGYCLQPELPRTAAEAEASMIPLLAAARRSFFANRGVWDAIATSGPAVSIAHRESDVDEYLEVLDSFLAELTEGSVG
jgi:glutamate-1-semialdehyde 2,1-aminomutase